MKKMLKLAAVLVALFAMTNFIACSDGGSSSSSSGGGRLTIPLMEVQLSLMDT